MNSGLEVMAPELCDLGHSLVSVHLRAMEPREKGVLRKAILSLCPS